MSIEKFLVAQVRRLDPQNRRGRISAIYTSGSDPDIRTFQIARQTQNDPSMTLSESVRIQVSAFDFSTNQFQIGETVQCGMFGLSLKRER